MTEPWLFPESAKGLSRCPPKNAPLRIRLIHTLGHEMCCSYERRKAHRLPSICNRILPARATTSLTPTRRRRALDPRSPRDPGPRAASSGRVTWYRRRAPSANAPPVVETEFRSRVGPASMEWSRCTTRRILGWRGSGLIERVSSKMSLIAAHRGGIDDDRINPFEAAWGAVRQARLTAQATAHEHALHVKHCVATSSMGTRAAAKQRASLRGTAASRRESHAEQTAADDAAPAGRILRQTSETEVEGRVDPADRTAPGINGV